MTKPRTDLSCGKCDRLLVFERGSWRHVEDRTLLCMWAIPYGPGCEKFVSKLCRFSWSAPRSDDRRYCERDAGHGGLHRSGKHTARGS